MPHSCCASVEPQIRIVSASRNGLVRESDVTMIQCDIVRDNLGGPKPYDNDSAAGVSQADPHRLSAGSAVPHDVICGCDRADAIGQSHERAAFVRVDPGLGGGKSR